MSTNALDFGAVRVEPGQQSSNTQLVGITNEGDCALQIEDVYVDGDALGVFDLGALSTPILEPGATASVTIAFTPVTDATHNAQLLVSSSDPGAPISSVSLVADGIAPAILVSPETHDFGVVDVGCEASQPVTISNVGRADLVVYAFRHNAASTEMVLDAGGAELDLPLTLAPEQSVELSVRYLPLDEYDDRGYLFADSNDPFTPETLARQSGQGEIYGHNTDIFEQPLQAETDIVFAVDKSGSMVDDIANVIANFHAFISTLEGLDVDFRVAAIVEDGGSVTGSVPYISPANAEDGVEIISEMLGGEPGSATEMAFTLLYSGMGTGANRPGNWIREGAKLNLIGVSDEPEQSRAQTWDRYVEYFQGLKDDPDMVAMHAIGGDYPRGCASAEPYTGFYEATVATSGLFLSICSADFARDLVALAEEAAVTLDHFALTMLPVPETITVAVNGVPATSGWYYQPQGNAVFFEGDRVPEGGSTIEIDYAVMSDCDF